MGFFDRFRRPADADSVYRKAIVELVLGMLRDKNGRIHVEDAVSAAATIVAERCIDATGDYPLRSHDFAPGSSVFSTKANELICGDVCEGGISHVSPNSIIGVLRSRLNRGTYPDVEFPDLVQIFRQFAQRIGNPAEWGKVPLSVPAAHYPFIPPLKIGYESRPKVDGIFSDIRDDKARCLRIAAEALADILAMVASAIDHKLVLTLAIETINGMAKTAPMTDQAMQKVQQSKA